MTSPDLKESLGTLVAVILDQIEQGRRGGSLIQSRQVYFRWRLEGELTYSEQGVKVPPVRGETIVRSSWAQAIAVIAQGETLQSKEYQAAVAAVRNVPEVAQNADQLLPQFVFTVTRKAFESDPPPPRAAFATTIQRFLDDIAGVPFECGADVNLQGLALERDKIEVFPGVTLRRPKREDFEVETPYYGPGINPDVSSSRHVVSSCHHHR